jgi:hypothetical protein
LTGRLQQRYRQSPLLLIRHYFSHEIRSGKALSFTGNIFSPTSQIVA